MIKIDYKNKFVVICAWCEKEKGEKYEEKGYRVSHGMCEKCCTKY